MASDRPFGWIRVAGVTLTSGDFFVPRTPTAPWDTATESLDRDRLTALIERPDPAHRDLDIALALMDLVRDDFTMSGTDGSGKGNLTDDEMRLAVRALQSVTARTGHEFKLPYRDHTTWRAWWIRNNAHGSWQARRDLLSELFDERYAALMSVQEGALDATLVEAISPYDRLGWPEIDTEIGELRRHFRAASTPQDYRAVGNDCVHVTEALSRKVYDHASHTPEGEDEPPVARTKTRLDRYIAVRLPGADNAALRKFARALIELAQAVKHSGTPTRTEAGVLADAVITLANMLRRLDEEQRPD